MSSTKTLSPIQQQELIATLKLRFEDNMARHPGVDWISVQERIERNPDKMWSLFEMERTGGEPDLVEVNDQTGEFIFFDCATETPKGRRSLCYDRAALESRKQHKPQSSAVDVAREIGIELLTEQQYHRLQQLGIFDGKTSSWLATPDDIRNLGGAIFGDWRFGRVFIYHNGAESYYASRGFRGSLTI